MLRAYYRSSRAALVVGVAAFAVSILLMRTLHVPADVVFAPGLLIQGFLNWMGADLPRRIAVPTTLFAWCLVADAFFMLLRRPWRQTENAKG
jgi:hypothetical protein